MEPLICSYGLCKTNDPHADIPYYGLTNETRVTENLNDSTGKYRVRARDLLSGGEGSAKVLVLPVAEL